MKIRNGFVSNSSTASYIILGWKIDGENEAKEFLDKYFPLEQTFSEFRLSEIEAAKKYKWDLSEEEIRNLYYRSTRKYKDCLFSVSYSGEDNIYYVGIRDSVCTDGENVEIDLNGKEISCLKEVSDRFNLPSPRIFGTTEGTH